MSGDQDAPRRQAFDAITMGWGSDDFDTLGLRIEESARWMTENGESVDQLRPGERKIVKAMIERQIRMGIAQGDFEDCGIPAAEAATIDLGGDK